MGVLIAGWLGIGCAASAPNPGHLEVRIKDHREAIGDFSELWLTFSAVGIHPTGQPRSEGWIEFEPSLQRLDLTQYVEGREAVIAQTTVEPGIYNAVRLHVDQVSATLSNGQPAEVKVNFEAVALDFQVQEGQTTVLGLDLVVSDLTDHPGLSYELHLREAAVRGDE
ncbi:MAG: DUF4382 domain-containing protein [Chloroflexi bacterium]|nr:DUF4382 domain-containing protein [Chloroflexota bacterium]